MANQIPLVAGGDIRPARFIKLSGAADYTALESDANERVFGISIDAAQDAPIPSADADAADDGDQFRYFSIGDECLLELGGTVAAADLLKSDADGKGVVIATTGTTIQNIGARAIEAGVSGEKIRVQVTIYSERPALT